jgi:serine/threonine protein kinase
MGSVYRAWDANLQTDVVVKMPHANAQDPEPTARFAREASSLVKLSHPHIVKIVDFGEQAGQPFAVMQFLSGGSLATRMETSSDGLRYQSFDSLKDWLPDIAKALDFVHARGYLHRDVKPANILFDEYGNAFWATSGSLNSRSLHKQRTKERP